MGLANLEQTIEEADFLRIWEVVNHEEKQQHFILSILDEQMIDQVVLMEIVQRLLVIHVLSHVKHVQILIRIVPLVLNSILAVLQILLPSYKEIYALLHVLAVLM